MKENAPEFSASQNNKRIAKNTLMLYFRMILTMLVSLYTSRVVLNTLGVEDFGIYNVVGGFVTMFGFLNNAMASATQRFLAFEIGKKDFEQLRNVFSMSVNIHFLIAFIILLLAETVGFWFVNTKLTIPSYRMDAVQWVYQFSIFAMMVNMISVPYNAMIIAHERMNVFAWISIIEVSLKLIIVFMLQWFGFDKLKFYAVLTFGVSLIIRIIYSIYCRKNLKGSKFQLFWDKELYKTLLNFTNWNIWGSSAWVIMGQGLNILLNIFFGPVVNAARGIAFQVNNVVNSFANNFRTAVNPQIIKSYSTDNISQMNKLALNSAKYSFFLLLLISLPIILEINMILRIWLKTVPEYTALFCQLILINSMIHSLDISIIFLAMGRIKENQFYGGLIYILTLPISYLFLKLRYPPEIVFYIQIVSTICVDFGINLFLLKKIALITISQYTKMLILPIFKVIFFVIIPPIILKHIMSESILRLALIITASSISILLSVYFGIIGREDRLLIKNTITFKIKKHKNG